LPFCLIMALLQTMPDHSQLRNAHLFSW
jgi:hypothetical protein